MDWKHLRDSLVNSHPGDLQAMARIDWGIAKIKDGVEELCRLGHPVHLIDGPEPPPKRFPRLVYHFEKSPHGFLVLCEEDLEFLGDGWFDTLAEAQHADGMGMQFRRGGVFPTRALPAIISDGNGLTRLDKLRKNGLE